MTNRTLPAGFYSHKAGKCRWIAIRVRAEHALSDVAAKAARHVAKTGNTVGSVFIFPDYGCAHQKYMTAHFVQG